MAIIAAGWKDLGFRKVQALPVGTPSLDTEKVSGFFAGYGGYRREANEWVRLRGRGRGEALPRYVALAAVVTSANRADRETFAWAAPFLASTYGKAARGHLPKASLATCGNLVRTLLDAKVPRHEGFANIGKGVGFVPPAELPEFLKSVVFPVFFEAFPSGKVAIVRTDESSETQAGMMRGLYALAYTQLADIKHVDGFPALKEWQEVSGHSMIRLALELFGYLTYPFVTSYRCGTLGLDFVFVADPAPVHELPVYPGDWLALLRSRSSFGEEDVDGLQAIANAAGPEAVAVTHRRYVHQTRFSATEQIVLLDWWISQLNALLVDLLDPANFTVSNDPSSPIDPVYALEHHLTISRLLKRLAAVHSVAEGSHAKGIIFEVADLLDGLMHRTRGSNDTDHFHLLFDPTRGPALLRGALGHLPEPFRGYFMGLVDTVYAELKNAILNSIWVPGKRVGATVLVRSRDLQTEAPMPEDEFVYRAIRAYRNGHHGYFTQDRETRPSRFLYMLNGNTPDSMSALATLWLLALMADPTSIAGLHRVGVGYP